MEPSDKANDYSSLDANRDYFQTVLPFSVILGILAAIGIFVNIFILYVYAFKYPTCNFKYFVLVLGIIDFLSCCLTIPGEIYTHYTWFTMPSIGLCKAKSFFNTATVTCSSVVLLLISIDRFRKICCPHGWQIRPHHALRLSLGLIIVASLWVSPAIVLCGPQSYEMVFRGGTINVTICLKDDAYKDTIWPPLVMKGMYVGPNIVIMVITVVLYIFIGKVIFQRTKENKASRNASIMDRIAREEKTTNDNITKSETWNGSGFARDETTMHDSHEKSKTWNASSSEREETMVHDTLSLEKSDTWNDPSFVDSEFPTMHNHLRDEQRKSNEFSVSITPEDTLNRDIANIPPCFHPHLPIQNRRRTVKRSHRPKRKRHDSKQYAKVLRRRSYARVRRKTLMMFILTAFFVVSTSIYLFFASRMSDNGEFFQNMTLEQEIIVMFFYRFYYFNSLVNAVVYGVLDPRFRRAIRRVSRRVSWSVTSRSFALPMRD